MLPYTARQGPRPRPLDWAYGAFSLPESAHLVGHINYQPWRRALVSALEASGFEPACGLTLADDYRLGTLICATVDPGPATLVRHLKRGTDMIAVFDRAYCYDNWNKENDSLDKDRKSCSHSFNETDRQDSVAEKAQSAAFWKTATLEPLIRVLQIIGITIASLTGIIRNVAAKRPGATLAALASILLAYYLLVNASHRPSVFEPGDARSIPKTPYGGSVIHRVCRAHRLMLELTPGVAEPQTIFELLDLDPHARPFEPSANCRYAGTEWHAEMEAAVLDAWSRLIVSSMKMVWGTGHSLGHSHRGKELPTKVEALLVETMSAATGVLLDDMARNYYLGTFLPQLEGVKRKRRASELTRLCTEAWKEEDL